MKNFKLWWIFFWYTCGISAFVQFILLPYILPSLHAGNGLLNSSFDSITFHHSATVLADNIRTQGWSVWQLRPGGQLPVGIAAVFYFFLTPDPRVLIPFAAILHASATLILVNFMSLFIKNKVKAIICVLPFLVFPSNLQWTAQWHRDGFSILGVILVLRGIVLSVRLANNEDENWFFVNFRSIIFYAFGLTLIWLARPYIMAVTELFIRLFFGGLFLFFSIGIFKRKVLWQKALVISFSMLLIIFALGRVRINMSLAEFKENATVPVNVSKEKIVAPKVEPKVEDKSKSTDIVASNVKKVPASTFVKERVKTEEFIKQEYIENHWERSPWLPLFIDNKAYSLALSRKGFRLSAPEAKSNIDSNIGFGSIEDILLYLPRAIQIAFLAPFPNQWLGEGSRQANSLMRRISAFEMIVIYFALIFLPYTIWYWRKRAEIWILFIFCTYLMLMHGLVVCNIGTLYRLRYVYITILASLGIAGFITLLERLKIKRDNF